MVRIAARSTGTITEAYSLKPMAKKSAETIFTRFDTTSGRLAVSAINPAAMTKASIVPFAEPQRSQHGNHDWREDQRRPIVGKQRRHSRAEQDNPGKQQTTPASSPAGNVQRGPFEKARLIKQQADNDNGDKGGGRIPDDMPYHRDIGYLYATGGQRQRRAKCRAPADPLTPRLPDHQHRGQDKNRTCQQHRSSANHIRKIIYVKINFYRQPGPPASLLIISRTSSC